MSTCTVVDRLTSYVQLKFPASCLALSPGFLQLLTIIAIASNIGSAYATTYGREIVSRIFVGVGASVALAIGAATVRFRLCPSIDLCSH